MTKRATSKKDRPPSFPSGRWKPWLGVLGFAIIVWITEEFLLFKFGWDLWKCLPKITAGILTALGILCSGILSLVVDKNKVPFSRSKDVPFWMDARIILKRLFLRYFRYNTLTGILLITAGLVTIPAYAAHQHTAQRVIGWFTTPADSTQPIPEPSGPLYHPDPELIPQDGTSAESEPQEEEPRDSRSLAWRLLLNAAPPCPLSQTEYNAVFFLDGPYMVTDWDSEGEVSSAVRGFVLEQQGKRRFPNYEEAGTPQDIQDSIARASRFEREMESAQDLERVIDMRVNLYEADPGYPLAKLLRENYGLYGNAYLFQNTAGEEAFILYADSVLWGFECLSYEVSQKNVLRDLRVLEERYAKITQVTTPGCFKHLCAEKLSQAFCQMADEMEKQ